MGENQRVHLTDSAGRFGATLWHKNADGEDHFLLDYVQQLYRLATVEELLLCSLLAQPSFF